MNPTPTHKIAHKGPKKVKKQNKRLVDPKTVYELKPTSKIAKIGKKGSKWPQKLKVQKIRKQKKSLKNQSYQSI